MAQAVRSSSLNSNNGLATSLVIAKPAGTIDGDLLVTILQTDGANLLFNTLAGWTAHPAIQQGTANCCQIFYKIAASEPANWTWTSPSVRGAGVVLCISGASITLDTSSINQNLGINNMVGGAVTPVAANEVLIWVGTRPSVAANGVISEPPNQTTRQTVNTGNTPQTCQTNVAAAVYASVAATPAGWMNGQLGGGATSNSSVFQLLFKDPVVVASAAAPLLFCEA